MPQKTFQYIATVYIAMHCVVANAQNWGQFIGTVETRWIDDRRMELLKDFTYTDPENNTWPAPKGSIIDGASIPKIAWSVIGGPYEGNYRAASVIHDVACIKKTRDWQSTHKAFYTAMNASGVDQTLSKIMYAAVYHFGPRWKKINIPIATTEELVKQIDSLNKIPYQHAIITKQGKITEHTSRPSLGKNSWGVVPFENTKNKVQISDAEIAVEEFARTPSSIELQQISTEIKSKNLSIQEIEQMKFEK